jgi:hypothetical protein
MDPGAGRSCANCARQSWGARYTKVEGQAIPESEPAALSTEPAPQMLKCPPMPMTSMHQRTCPQTMSYMDIGHHRACPSDMVCHTLTWASTGASLPADPRPMGASDCVCAKNEGRDIGPVHYTRDAWHKEMRGRVPGQSPSGPKRLPGFLFFFFFVFLFPL